MKGWPWQKKQTRPGDASWRNRKAHRYSGETVRCALGEIADLSASGMRVICNSKPPVKSGGVMPIRLKFSDGTLEVGTQVRWCKRRGLKRYELGLKFIQLKPGMEKVLEAIARFGMAQAAKHMRDEPSETTNPQNHRQKQDRQHIQAEIDLPNYYQVLELEPDATPAQIKSSYRKLATQYHPDRSDAPDAMQRFEAINEAYHILCDAKRRASYHRMAG